jgi:hypothetical protein
MTAPGDALDGLWDKDGNFLGHEPCRCGDNHRTTGERAWCSPCQEWCYPDDGCRGCKPDVDDLMEQVAAQAERIAALEQELVENVGVMNALRRHRDTAEAKLAAVGPVVAAAQAVVAEATGRCVRVVTNGDLHVNAQKIAALVSAVREMGEQQ